MTAKITRRKVLGTLLAGSAAACSPKPKTEYYTAQTNAVGGAFSHGIASGDPLSDRVIIWTRITPEPDLPALITLSWQMALDPEFTQVIKQGNFETGAARDYTVKVDVTGLSPQTSYFYRFHTDSYTSPTGHTHTLPVGSVNKLRFAVVSCANWQHGYFNVYDHITRVHEDAPFDALLHLGDYFYEYGPEKGNADMMAKGRVHDPAREIIALPDYRARHAQYRTDPALQQVTARLPMIAIWDDHENSNDSWKDGAENHNPGEGEWAERKEAAMRAYYEWMPVREPGPGEPLAHLYRTFEWGDLATMTAVETRLLARGAPIIIEDYFDMLRQDGGAEKFKAEILNDPSRAMLGAAQRDYIASEFAASKAAGKPWRILANQVVMGQVMTPDLRPYVDEEAKAAIEKEWDGIRSFVELSGYNLPLYPDSWDGYPAARETFYAALKGKGVTDMLVLTGDAHEFWANDLKDNSQTKIGVELGTSSVSSRTLAAFLGGATADYALLMTKTNPGVRYYNPLYRGYIDLTIEKSRAKARMVAVDNVTSPEYGAFTLAAFTVKPSGNSLKLSEPKNLNVKQRALFNGFGQDD